METLKKYTAETLEAVQTLQDKLNKTDEQQTKIKQYMRRVERLLNLAVDQLEIVADKVEAGEIQLDKKLHTVQQIITHRQIQRRRFKPGLQLGITQRRSKNSNRSAQQEAEDARQELFNIHEELYHNPYPFTL